MERVVLGKASTVLALLAILVVTPMASAASVAPATAIPSPALRVVYEVTNPSSVPTGPFDLAVSVDSLAFETYLAPYLSNEIWTYTDGEPIPSWIETNATPTSPATLTWLRLDRGVGADSTLVLWLNIYPTSDLLMDPAGPSGEAPQLTAPYYGLFDDGAEVFPIYDNFAGSELSPAWIEYIAWGGTNTSTPVAVNNGLTESVGTVSQSGGVWVEHESALVPPVTVDALVTGQTVPSNFGIGEFDDDNGLSNGAGAPGVVFVARLDGQQYAEGCSTDFHSGYSSNGTVGGDFVGVHSLTWYPNSTFSVGLNYRTVYGFSSGGIPAPAHVRVGVGLFPWASDSTGSVQWVRARLLPAAGSQPSVAFSEAYVPIAPTGPPRGAPGAAYFSIVPGTATKTRGSGFDLFVVPEFVLAEPVGAATNLSVTNQVWETLQLAYLGDTTPFENWSVSEPLAGKFTLTLNLTDEVAAQIEAGASVLALSAEVVIGNSTLGASGTIGATVLSGATTGSGWWSTWFGMPGPPPGELTTVNGVVADLAWLGESETGRAIYMGSTLVAVALYLWEGHKLAKARLTGNDKAAEARKARAAGASQ